MNILKKIELESKKYYLDKSESNEDAIRVGWKNELAQETRFNQLFRSFELQNMDVITDVGCGLGDLYLYLNKNFPNLNITYRGVDVLEEMISKAKKKHNINLFEKIDSVASLKKSDYIVASGIFNLKHNATDNDWLEYIYDTISLMYKKSNKGISFNCLTNFSDKEFMRKELFYSNPMEIFEFCMKKLSPNVTLYHDYKQFDFTISIIK